MTSGLSSLVKVDGLQAWSARAEEQDDITSQLSAGSLCSSFTIRTPPRPSNRLLRIRAELSNTTSANLSASQLPLMTLCCGLRWENWSRLKRTPPSAHFGTSPWHGTVSSEPFTEMKRGPSLSGKPFPLSLSANIPIASLPPSTSSPRHSPSTPLSPVPPRV